MEEYVCEYISQRNVQKENRIRWIVWVCKSVSLIFPTFHRVCLHFRFFNSMPLHKKIESTRPNVMAGWWACWLWLSTKICMLTSIIFMQSHISLIFILFSLLKYLLQWGSTIITTFMRMEKFPRPPLPETGGKEHIEYYWHENDKHFPPYLQWLNCYKIKFHTINKNICCGSHRFIIAHMMMFHCMKHTHLDWKFFLMMWHYFITTVKPAKHKCAHISVSAQCSKQFIVCH